MSEIRSKPLTEEELGWFGVDFGGACSSKTTIVPYVSVQEIGAAKKKQKVLFVGIKGKF